MENTVKIPKFLHEIHGDESNWFDIIATHSVALITVFGTVYLANPLELQGWKTILLIILAYDLGGGVLANFTYSTNWYYEQASIRRKVFLALHVLQPFFMILVFPEYLNEILVYAAYTLASSFRTNAIKDVRTQLIAGSFFSLTGIIVLHSLSSSIEATLSLLFTLFLLKLPLSFSVRWYRLKGF